ncbi:hypothetical protein C1H76_1777 [Elsinoe australis]|uniref:Uncharacterized protein n=1 Tax=Elsinoe australis TaxID=40998 RepID=A0A4U7B897_9PEZI|nr:hypothetical protein C1H76_1777 [Elsinoe australis]
MFRPTPITPPSPTPPSLDRRNSDPCRSPSGSVQPMSASSLLAGMIAVATRQPIIQSEPTSPRPPSLHEEKLEWETLSRRGSDPSEGYISFPDFDRFSRSSSSDQDETPSA